MHELLLNRSKFTNHLSSVCTRDERVLQVQKLLQTIENQIANGVHTPATITVIDDKEISDSSYNHRKNAIKIPYKAGAHGLYYYSSLIHEDAHAKQTYGQQDQAERTLLDISRAIYPPEERIADDNNTPTNEYLYNYSELDAKCAEINAVNDAFTARIKAIPPDCDIIEKDEMLKVMQDIWSVLYKQQSQFSLYLVRLKNITSIIAKDYDEDVMPCKTAEAVYFLTTKAPELYQAKFDELQAAIQKFRANMQALEKWTSPEYRDKTKNAEQKAMKNYLEQEHQNTIQFVRASGVHYNQFPPANAQTEMLTIKGDMPLCQYIATHQQEEASLYIVHIELSPQEHVYDIHRVLPENVSPKNIPESKEDEQMLHSNFDECTQITEQYNDEMDVDCL